MEAKEFSYIICERCKHMISVPLPKLEETIEMLIELRSRQYLCPVCNSPANNFSIRKVFYPIGERNP